jgi:hypothetical protein
MVAKNTRHLLLCILAAQVVCGLHQLCLFERTIYDLDRMWQTRGSDDRLLRVIDSVMLITHLSNADFSDESPKFLGIDIFPLAFVACVCIGYAVGFATVHFWNRQILSVRLTSFIWWLCMAIVASDLCILVLLMNNPFRSLFWFLKLQVPASIGTAVVFVILGISKLKTWLQTR